MLFLGSFDAYPLENAAAVRLASQQILADSKNPNKGLRKKCEAVVQAGSTGASAGSSVVIMDKDGNVRFGKKVIEGHKIIYCGYDPEQRL